ncbi:MAG: apolipoprotein N-acyltransferase [Rubrivivax sp.]|nr:apolipoprotein N-acyltransferase [Rubrivivax sp.]
MSDGGAVQQPRAGAGRTVPVVLEAPALAALGALQTLAFVHTAWWPLPLVAVAGLAARLARAAPGRAFVLGWSFGTGWLLAGVWWLFISMHRYGALPAPLAALAVLALAAALSLYLGAAAAAFARWRRGVAASDALLFAALWLLAELARGVLFTGFPWVASGYSQVDAPLAGLAPWLGVYGMGAAVAGIAAAVAFGCMTRAWAAVAAALALPVALVLVPVPAFTRAAGDLTVALVQTNVPQDEKFDAERLPQTLAAVHKALLTARADLVVVPETAVPLLPDQLRGFAPGYWEGLVEHFGADARATSGASNLPRAPGSGRAALVGVPLGDFDRGYTNSVVGLGGTAPYRYDKAHLVPFGEFIPFGFRWFTELMNIPLGDFTRGRLDPPPFAAAGQRIAPNICYEDLFGEELARRFAGGAAAAPTLMANLSNIAWFGPTVAVQQHLHISRLRTLEFQVPMVRATNTGATAAITHEARVAAMVLPHTRGTLVARVQGREGVTPYAWWAGRFGLAPLALVALAVVAWAARQRRPGVSC